MQFIHPHVSRPFGLMVYHYQKGCNRILTPFHQPSGAGVILLVTRWTDGYPKARPSHLSDSCEKLSEFIVVPMTQLLFNAERVGNSTLRSTVGPHQLQCRHAPRIIIIMLESTARASVRPPLGTGRLLGPQSLPRWRWASTSRHLLRSGTVNSLTISV